MGQADGLRHACHLALGGLRQEDHERQPELHYEDLVRKKKKNQNFFSKSNVSPSPTPVALTSHLSLSPPLAKTLSPVRYCCSNLRAFSYAVPAAGTTFLSPFPSQLSSAHLKGGNQMVTFARLTPARAKPRESIANGAAIAQFLV